MFPGPGDQQTRVLPVCRHQGPGGGVAREDTELSLEQHQKIYIPISFSLGDTAVDKEDLDYLQAILKTLYFTMCVMLFRGVIQTKNNKFTIVQFEMVMFKTFTSIPTWKETAKQIIGLIFY